MIKELCVSPQAFRSLTYSGRMKVNVDVEVFVKKVFKRDKFKTGQDEYVERQILSKKTQDIPIGRIPVMVRSLLCNSTEDTQVTNEESVEVGNQPNDLSLASLSPGVRSCVPPSVVRK